MLVWSEENLVPKKVSEPVSERIWYRKKSQNRLGENLVPKKCPGTGLGQIFGLVTHWAIIIIIIITIIIIILSCSSPVRRGRYQTAKARQTSLTSSEPLQRTSNTSKLCREQAIQVSFGIISSSPSALVNYMYFCQYQCASSISKVVVGGG